MIHKKKLTLLLIVAVILIALGFALLTAGFIVPPMGVIDSSVLIAYGETSTFAGALIGVDYNYKYKIQIHKIEDKEIDE